MADKVATLDFLTHIYGENADGWLTLFARDRAASHNQTRWVPAHKLDQLAAEASDLASTCCVWWGVATRKERLDGGKRGGRSDCLTLPGLWVDIDVAGPGHKDSENLPLNVAAGQLLLDGFGLPPTVTTHTGGGLQAFWLLRRSIHTSSSVVELCDRWGQAWLAYSKTQGVHVDSVFNVDRIMRLPGTDNTKAGGRVPVVVVQSDWGRRFTPAELEAHCESRVKSSDHRVATSAKTKGEQSGDVLEPRNVSALDRSDRPGDSYNRGTDPASFLLGLGWSYAHSDPNGDRHYTRPGKDPREGTSATIYADGHTTIWSDTVAQQYPGIELRRPYDPFGLLTVMVHNGDYRSSAESLEKSGFGERSQPTEYGPGIGLGERSADARTDRIHDSGVALSKHNPVMDVDEQPSNGWTPADLQSFWDGDGPEPPAIFSRLDGVFLLYRGRVHSFTGEPEGMKSWGWQVAAWQTLSNGGRVLVIDFENDPASVVERLRALGVKREQLGSDTFVYINPDSAFTDEVRDELAHIVLTLGPDLAVLDGITDGMSLFGLDSEKGGGHDVAVFDHKLVRPLARSGAAVVMIDHVVKDRESRGSWSIGSQHKKSAITGAAFMFEVIKPFGRGMVGESNLLIMKDKPGHLRPHGVGPADHCSIGVLRLTSWPDGTITAELDNPKPEDDDGGFRPTTLMEKVSRWIEANPGMSKNAIAEAVKGRKESTILAIELLVAEGFVIVSLGLNRAQLHSSQTPYRQSHDLTQIGQSDPSQGM